MTEQRADLPVLLFENQASFEVWLDSQSRESKGAWLRFARKHAKLTSLAKQEAIDSALCYGWIDGQLDKYDADSWLIRFTPRKVRSKWSRINRDRAAELIDQGKMKPGGQAEIELAKADGRWDSAYAPASTIEIPSDLQDALDQSPEAKAFFTTLTGANRYAVLYRIGSVKRAETRARKIAEYVAMLQRGETIHG